MVGGGARDGGDGAAALAAVAAEAAARAAYGRLVAVLAARTRDVAAAEDALQGALEAALRTWPERGVPGRPEAWLLTAARRGLGHERRRLGVRAAAAPHLRLLAEEAAAAAAADRGGAGLPDRRLELLFVCAHPLVEPGARAPLMLRAVLGLDAARIASAFLAAPAAMGQRLVRAQARVREARIPFEVPGPEELPGRLEAVLDAIYAAYGSGWEDVAGADPRPRGLADEALHLARLAAAHLPGEPEARGLAALLLHCEARRPARRGPDGAFVPLGQQDARLWSAPMLAAAEAELSAAAAAGRPGRYQLEAAIQSAHAAPRARGAAVPWGEVALLYEGLVGLTPALGAAVGRAAALGEAFGPGAGLAALDALPAGQVAAYQPHWALRAHLLQRAGAPAEARAAFARALGLTEDPAVRDFLRARAGPAAP